MVKDLLSSGNCRKFNCSAATAPQSVSDKGQSVFQGGPGFLHRNLADNRSLEIRESFLPRSFDAHQKKAPAGIYNFRMYPFLMPHNCGVACDYESEVGRWWLGRASDSAHGRAYSKTARLIHDSRNQLTGPR